MENLSDILFQHHTDGNPAAFTDFLFSDESFVTSMGHAMKLTGHKGCINTCCFNPFGDRLLTGSDDGCVWIWDIGTRAKEPIIMLRPHITNVFTTNFLSSNRFISGANDAAVQVVELTESGAKTRSFINHHIRKVLCSFVIDPNTFVTCSFDETIRIFDIRQSYPGAEVHDLELLTKDDFNYNAYKRLTDDLRYYNLLPQGHGGGKAGTPPISHDETLLLDLRDSKAQLFKMDVHPIDRKRFIAGGSDGTVHLFDLRSINGPKTTENIGFSVREVYGSEMKITGAAFDDYGERIAASALKGNIHIFNTSTAQELDSWTPPPPPPPTRRAYSTDEINILNFIRANRGIDIEVLQEALIQQEEHLDARVYEEEEEEEEVEKRAPGCIQVLKGHDSNETDKACNWMGDFVVTGSDNGIIYLYNVETGKVRKVLNGHESNVNVVAVHKQKQLLATSGVDYYAMLWEPNNFTRFNEELNEIEIQKALETAEMHSRSGMDCNVM
jgi:WD40 repeat protein